MDKRVENVIPQSFAKTPKAKRGRDKQPYYFEWYLRCPNCKTMYMVEAAKRFSSTQGVVVEERPGAENGAQSGVVHAVSPDVVIYTDGGAIGNPGPGGYGSVVRCGSEEREFSAGYRLTTNNRMELLAAIVALESLAKPQAVQLYSDSKYLVNRIQLGWAKKWKKNGWMRTSAQRALNAAEEIASSCPFITSIRVYETSEH